MNNTILKSIQSFVLALVITVLSVSQALSVVGNTSKEKHAGKGCLKQAMKELNLTDKQKEQIKNIREGFKTRNESKLTELKSLREALRSAKEAKDEAKVKELRTQLKTKAESLQSERESMRTSISAVLTPEQKAKLDEILKNCKDNKPSKGGAKRGANIEAGELE